MRKCMFATYKTNMCLLETFCAQSNDVSVFQNILINYQYIQIQIWKINKCYVNIYPIEPYQCERHYKYDLINDQPFVVWYKRCLFFHLFIWVMLLHFRCTICKIIHQKIHVVFVTFRKYVLKRNVNKYASVFSFLEHNECFYIFGGCVTFWNNTQSVFCSCCEVLEELEQHGPQN